MISLRAKFTFALLVMSFVAIGVVGITSYKITQVQFEDLVVSRAMERFVKNITEYYVRYGSWENARNAEHYLDFDARTRRLLNSSIVRLEDEGRRRPPPPPNEVRRLPPPEQHIEFGAPPPPFLVVDQNGIVLIDLAGRNIGEVITPQEMNRAEAIFVDNIQIALAVPLDRPILTDIEERYLAAIEYSWLYSLLVAIVLAIPVGIVLGHLFTAPIEELRKAIRGMQDGKLRQLVRVRSNDEIGQLSSAFNLMSENLAIAYEKLEKSRTRLSVQAVALEELSRRDELTQLQNRRAFDDLAPTLFAQARRFSHSLTFAMADIDHFKKVNDDYSHAVGDKVLQEVANLINTTLREIDLIARYGGEEFVITFPQTDIEGATIFANRLRERVAAYDWEQLTPGFTVTLSIGLAQWSTEDSFKEVLKVADARLYDAKSKGRNQVCS
ncbi:MAG: two-component system cell cycle response regulator [Gammaproteobacteria bacterium]